MSRKFNFPEKRLPTGVESADIIIAHDHSINNRDIISRSDKCGCYGCASVYDPSKIVEWTDKIDVTNVTAICPGCGLDSVIGSESGFNLDESFLLKMKDYFFNRFVEECDLPV